MKIAVVFAISLIFFATGSGYALEPNQILIIANCDSSNSVRIAEYYCDKRSVPKDNILPLHLGAELTEEISREDYENKLVAPIRRKIHGPEFFGKIRCLLTTYGVPIKVGGRGLLKGQEETLRQLQKSARQERDKLEQLQLSASADAAGQRKKVEAKLTRLQSAIDSIDGKETSASVDSELSMVLFEGYELYRWQENRLKDMPYWDFKSLMVSRLDGANAQIAQQLVDKALTAEKNGLKGAAYIDSRGIADDKKPYSFGCFDQSLRDLADVLRGQTAMTVIEEKTDALFSSGQCPETAIYCGWYSVKKYIDAFDFLDGAIGYHIASWEAIDLRDANSPQWCPAMLADGITATLGAVAEPYLSSFPQPKPFFEELLNGSCLVEAFYHTKPFNSWQLVLIGDPLYTPFRVGGTFSGKTPAE
jgi:uncharacterized protein (TIGR03790 family)